MGKAVKLRKWDRYEVAVLLQTYLNVADGINRTSTAKNLSNALRQYAETCLHIEISSVYRNYNGINMRIANIEYLFSEGKRGLASYSKLDKELFDMYCQEPHQFEELLSEAWMMIYKKELPREYVIDAETKQKKCNIAEEKNDVKNLLSPKEMQNEFEKWMLQNGMAIKISDKVLFKVIDSQEALNIIDKLFENEEFVVHNKIQHNSYRAIMAKYYEYIGGAVPKNRSVIVK